MFVALYKLFLLRNSILWNIMACSPVKFNGRFGGTYQFHVQGRRVSQARNKQQAEQLAIATESSVFL
jgi:hypothetical protein